MVAAAIAALAAAGPTGGLTLKSEQPLPITFNQGVARVPGGWILSGTNFPVPDSDVLVRTDENLVPQITKTGAIPKAWKDKGYVHIGDIDVVGDVVYAPFEERDYTLGHQATARYNATTLDFIDAVELPQHENSFVAVDPTTMTAWSQDHFDGDTLLRYDINAGWKPLPPLKMNETLHSTQGAAIVPGGIWISTSDPANDIYFVDTTTGIVDKVGTHAHAGGEGEGVDASTANGTLDALENDVGMASTWFEHFGLPTIKAVVQTPQPTSSPGPAAAPTRPRQTASTGTDGAIAMWGLAAFAAAVCLLALRRRAARSDAAAREAEEPVGS